ncbi:MAG: hypothetical protein IT261_07080, partial [Saprospiraceae bacterium]|nr:hypothetical protein [Saprospiraceae bacterium]
MLRLFSILSFLVLSISTANAQASKNSDLFLTLKKQDSIFFERGFNLCDLEYLSQAVHQDLVFY